MVEKSDSAKANCECPKCRPLLWRSCHKCVRWYKVNPEIHSEGHLECNKGFGHYWETIKCSYKDQNEDSASSLVELA